MNIKNKGGLGIPMEAPEKEGDENWEGSSTENFMMLGKIPSLDNFLKTLSQKDAQAIKNKNAKYGLSGGVYQMPEKDKIFKNLKEVQDLIEYELLIKELSSTLRVAKVFNLLKKIVKNIEEIDENKIDKRLYLDELKQDENKKDLEAIRDLIVVFEEYKKKYSGANFNVTKTMSNEYIIENGKSFVPKVFEAIVLVEKYKRMSPSEKNDWESIKKSLNTHIELLDDLDELQVDSDSYAERVHNIQYRLGRIQDSVNTKDKIARPKGYYPEGYTAKK